MNDRKIYLTFSLEECNLANKFGTSLAYEEQLALIREGLNLLLPILRKHNATATFFTSHSFATNNKTLLQQLSQQHEMAFNGYFPVTFTAVEETETGTALFDELNGLDFKTEFLPFLKPVEFELIKEAGSFYDLYFHHETDAINKSPKHSEITPGLIGSFLRTPSASSPDIRVPLFWLSFKNLPYWLFKKLSFRNIHKDGHINLHFYAWEFANLEEYDLPVYLKAVSGKKLANRLDKFLGELKTSTVFGKLDELQM